MPVNEAEAIFEPFWDPDISELDRYTVESAPGAYAAACQIWAYVVTSWGRSE